MTIWFIPQRYLAFINAYRSLLEKYELDENILYNSGYMLFNRVILSGGVNDTAQIKSIINSQFNLYKTVENRMSEYSWNVEQRPPVHHEISAFYDALILAIQLFVQDLLNAQSRALPVATPIKSLEITPLGGTIHV